MPEQKGGFPKGEEILIDKVKALPNVEIIYSAETTKILGSNRVTGLEYKNEKNKKQEIAVEGVMVHIGQIPNSQFADGNVEKNKIGETGPAGKSKKSVKKRNCFRRG